MANWLDALRAGDADALLALATDDVAFLTLDQPPQGRAQIDGNLRALFGMMNQVDASMEVTDIEVCGSQAFARTNMSVTITSKYGFAPIECAGHTLSFAANRRGQLAAGTRRIDARARRTRIG